jgi:carbon storage regulator
MLVISRKPGEKIYIGQDIVITITDVSGRLVKIGIDAPKSITILRSEIKDQIELENKTAAAKSKYLERFRNLNLIKNFRKS